MMKSKRRSEKKRNLSEHMLTLHQRLYQALNLGIKSDVEEGRIWKCTDIEIQRLAVRSISAFVGTISPDVSQHPIIKNSVIDMLVALEGITKSRNEAVLGTAVDVTLKLVENLGNSIPSPHVLKLVDLFSSLLSFPQSSIAASCAIALDHIISKLIPRGLKSQKECWEILEERKAVDCIVCSLEDFSSGIRPYEPFKEMASLLKTILWRWPSSRYAVWSNAKLMERLEALCTKRDFFVEVVLQLYSAIALCVHGAKKLLQNQEHLLPLILHCMDSSQPQSLRVQAFKLTQFLMRSEHGCSTIMSQCCESIVQAIFNTMAGWSPCSEKVAADHVVLLLEACRLALITRWAGHHHIYFWKLGIERVLLDLLLGNFRGTKQSQTFSSLDELIATAHKGLDANFCTVLRPYIWAILGWLAAHCGEDFKPDTSENKHCLNLLITCGCVTLMESIKGRHINQIDVSSTEKREPACKAVLLMVYSPCKYIASQARHILSEVTTSNVEVYLVALLDSLSFVGTRYDFSVVNNIQTVINLIGLACFSVLPKFYNLIIGSDGIMTLSTFIGRCLSNSSHDAPHLHYTSNGDTCCWLDIEDWQGGNNLLFFSLWSLAELMRNSKFMEKDGDLFSSQVASSIKLGDSDAQALVGILHRICGDTCSSPGLKWYATYILSFFGSYGFPSKLGKRLGKALHEKEHADVDLQLPSGESLRVHGVVLMVRCPSLFASREYPHNRSVGSGSAPVKDIQQVCTNFQRQVRLSARVDRQALLKLLEFVYMGIIEVDSGLVKQLKMLAKGCGIRSLSLMLGRKRPKWGSKVPWCDFKIALGPAGHLFSDVILEAKADGVVDWTCSICTLSLPHIHAHKFVLCSSCDYMKALFQSGMQESHALSIEVPVSWEALSKLVCWFYSDELPKPSTKCLWDNINVEQQLQEVHPYLELCWLAQFWFLEDIREGALRVIFSCLHSSKNLPFKIIQIAAKLSQWEVVELAANCMAPLYPQLRDSGDIESLEEELVDMVRVAYVHLSQSR